ncbi:MAG: NAD(P)H-dependent oxidoreductase [Planctomycetota bacterium]
MAAPRILAFSGSARNGSVNQKLVTAAAEVARNEGAEVTLVSLKDFEMPLFSQDLEAESGMPEAATRLKQLFFEHDGLLIASPEYNSSITPLLKNTIDWVSRAAEGEAPCQAYHGKIAGIMAASPGGLGGLRGLVHLRAILGNIGVTVVPDQMAISKAFDAFDEAGGMKDERQAGAIAGIAKAVVSMVAKLND